jgi:endonuclease YncB( thermonuclease family)
MMIKLKNILLVVPVLILCNLACAQEAGLPYQEIEAAQFFEDIVENDDAIRETMTTFTDPLFFTETSKLRKVWGRAVVLDGQTLQINGEAIGLKGIRAPDISQTCPGDILNFDAGGFALGRLKTWATNDKAVICYVQDGNPQLGTCFILGAFGPINIAKILVREGAVWADQTTNNPYLRDEGYAEGTAAMKASQGSENIWTQNCQRPE